MTRVNCGRVRIGTPLRAALLGVARVEPAAKRLALGGHG
jgi:hypothetical protein